MTSIFQVIKHDIRIDIHDAYSLSQCIQFVTACFCKEKLLAFIIFDQNVMKCSSSEKNFLFRLTSCILFIFQPFPSKPGAILIYNTRFSQSNQFLMNKIKIHPTFSQFSVLDQSDAFHLQLQKSNQLQTAFHVDLRIMLFKTEALDTQSAHLFHTSMMMMKHCSA